MVFVALTTVLQLVVCGAVLVAYGPWSFGARSDGTRGERMRSVVAWAAAALAALPLGFWAYVWLAAPRWSLAWELASIVQALLVVANAVLASRVGADWPVRVRMAVRVISIFAAALFLGLLAHSLLETLPSFFSRGGVSRAFAPA